MQLLLHNPAAATSSLLYLYNLAAAASSLHCLRRVYFGHRTVLDRCPLFLRVFKGAKLVAACISGLTYTIDKLDIRPHTMVVQANVAASNNK